MTQSSLWSFQRARILGQSATPIPRVISSKERCEPRQRPQCPFHEKRRSQILFIQSTINSQTLSNANPSIRRLSLLDEYTCRVLALLLMNARRLLVSEKRV